MLRSQRAESSELLEFIATITKDASIEQLRSFQKLLESLREKDLNNLKKEDYEKLKGALNHLFSKIDINYLTLYLRELSGNKLNDNALIIDQSLLASRTSLFLSTQGLGPIAKLVNQLAQCGFSRDQFPDKKLFLSYLPKAIDYLLRRPSQNVVSIVNLLHALTSLGIIENRSDLIGACPKYESVLTWYLKS